MSKADKRERQRENRERAREERERLIKRDKRLRALRGLLLVLVPVAIVFVVIALTRDDGSKKSTKTTTPTTSKTAPKMTIDPNKQYTATMVTSEGTMVLALDPKTAPVAANNFVSLARKGFYDGSTFHRVVKDFMIQGGAQGPGEGGPGYSVPGEVPQDHYPVGALGAAKTDAEPAGTMTSQFFIVTGAQGATLPNLYARFGNLTSGLDVAKKIEALAPSPGGASEAPTKRVTITKVTITES